MSYAESDLGKIERDYRSKLDFLLGKYEARIRELNRVNIVQNVYMKYEPTSSNDLTPNILKPRD